MKYIQSMTLPNFAQINLRKIPGCREGMTRAEATSPYIEHGSTFSFQAMLGKSGAVQAETAVSILYE